MEWLRIGFVDLRYSRKFLEDFIINCLKMFVNDVKVGFFRNFLLCFELVDFVFNCFVDLD